MSLSDALLDLLRCPSTRQLLQLNNNSLTSGEGEAYPVFEDLPWLLPDPGHSLVDWQIKVSTFYEYQIQEAKRLAARSQKAQGLTQQRLVRLARAKQQFARQAAELCQPLLQNAPDQAMLRAILPNQAPRTQNLLSYEANLYRDWVWGEAENQLSAAIIHKLLDGQTVNRLLIPGCGAGRLLYDLHIKQKPALSVGTDINPLLLFVAKHMLNNQAVPLFEFPSAPVNIEAVAIEQQLRPVAHQDNIHLLFADVLNSPFIPEAFDCLVTPWLIDILPSSLEITLKALNQYLSVGGTWINFGSLVFHQSDAALHYSVEEVVELATDHGFAIEAVEQHAIPYLHSPHNAGHRVEQVTAWRATKTHAVAAPNTTQHLPLWLLDTKAPVPAMAEFARAGQENAISGEILSWANGQLSLSKMASRLSKKYKVDKAAAEASILQLYRQIYEESLRRQYTL